ncbi:MAG: SxtJ family membrane protein [Planctomycetota bacterium]
MSLIEIDYSPSLRQLRVFALVWLVVFSAFGYAVYAAGWPAAAGVLWTLAVAVPIAGWIKPELLRWVYVGMAVATWPIGWVVSLVALGVIYYLVVTPTGWLMRLRGYDPMRRGFDPEAGTYWRRREPSDDVKRYFRQF